MGHAFLDIMDAFVERIAAAGISVSDKVQLDDHTDSLTASDAPGCLVSLLDVSPPSLEGIEDHDRRETFRVRVTVSPFVILAGGATRALWTMAAELQGAINGIDQVLGAQSFVPMGFSQLQKFQTKRGEFAFVDMIFDVYLVLDEADHTTII